MGEQSKQEARSSSTTPRAGDSLAIFPVKWLRAKKGDSQVRELYADACAMIAAAIGLDSRVFEIRSILPTFAHFAWTSSVGQSDSQSIAALQHASQDIRSVCSVSTGKCELRRIRGSEDGRTRLCADLEMVGSKVLTRYIISPLSIQGDIYTPDYVVRLSHSGRSVVTFCVSRDSNRPDGQNDLWVHVRIAQAGRVLLRKILRAGGGSSHEVYLSKRGESFRGDTPAALLSQLG